MPRLPRTDEERRDSFREWAGRFRRAAETYDSGELGEAKNLSGLLRMLLHDSREQCLLTQIGRKHIMFFNTPHIGVGSKLVCDEGGGFVTFAQDGSPQETAVAHSRPVYDLFDRGTWSHVKFSKWWKEQVLPTTSGKRVLSRRDLVLTMANEDGGAHIDRMIDEDYASVVRKEDMKVTFHVGSASASSKHGRHYPAVRQIAYEVQKTLDDGLSDLLEEPLTFPHPIPAEPTMRMSSLSQIKVLSERTYLEGILRSLEEAGERDSDMAREIKRQIFWETGARSGRIGS
jgi:hypothetical protein